MNRIVAFGEIMGRFVTPGFKRFQQALPGSLNTSFAGAEANIASSFAYLGGEAAFVTALPKNPIADACIASLRAAGVDTIHIVHTDAGRLGLYFLEQGANQRPTNVIARWVQICMDEAWKPSNRLRAICLDPLHLANRENVLEV